MDPGFRLARTYVGRLLIFFVVATFTTTLLPRPGLAQSSAQPLGEPEKTNLTAPAAELAEAWDRAYRIGNWPEAIRLGKLLCQKSPTNPAFLYNLACVYARMGELELGLATLEKASLLGFDNPMLLLTDGDLAALRSDPRFDSVVEKSQENRKRAQADFRSWADAQTPLIWTPPELDPETPAPVIIALHPYGSQAEWILDYWKSTALEQGAIVLAPRAVHPQGNGFEWGTIEDTQYLLGRSFEQLQDDFAIDESRILLTGFSQGAYMAFNLGRLHGDIVTSVLPVAGQYERELADPSLVPEDRRARFYILIGTEDPAYRSNIIALEDLRAAGFEVRLRSIQGLNHSFPDDYETELEAALDYLWK